MSGTEQEKIEVWKSSPMAIALFAVSLLASWYIFQSGISEMLNNWEREEYSHGYMIPFISLFLIWQRMSILETTKFSSGWPGVVITLVGILLYVIGSFSAVYDIVSYGFVVTIFGIVMSYTGVKGYKRIAIPLLILVFMIPIPDFLYASISNDLQLLSSKLGVDVIRMFGISVYLEGNVIDLGVYQLQVAEACSGLRYLFPLVTLGFIAAYFYKVELWKRLLVFVSTVPITVLMNSTRIGVIGVTVEYWGIEMAEGILHDFEGWFVFMTCIGVLIIEMAILTRIGSEKRALTEVFGLALPDEHPEDARYQTRKTGLPVFVMTAVLVATAAISGFMPERQDVIPARVNFSNFPMELGDWNGRSGKMERQYIDALNFDDYLLADYSRGDENLGLYIGYYAYQRADKVPHSPKACLPGGGWAITDINTRPIDGVSIDGVPLAVNRVVIQQGDVKQLVYYWFQQRGRIITNEWNVKLYLMVDAMERSRTDGALVRFTTIVKRDESMEDADRRLSDFAKSVQEELPAFIPK